MLYEQFDTRVWSSEICTEDKSFHMLVVYFKRLNETTKKRKMNVARGKTKDWAQKY